MIPVRIYKQYWEDMLIRVPDLKHLVFASSEDYLQKKIKDIGLWESILVAVIPSSKGIGNADAMKELQPCLIYVIQKIDNSLLTDDKFLSVQEQTQNVMERVKEFMLFDKNDFKNNCPMFKGLSADWNQDPEYNYMSCNGWSLAFNLITTKRN